MDSTHQYRQERERGIQRMKGRHNARGRNYKSEQPCKPGLQKFAVINFAMPLSVLMSRMWKRFHKRRNKSQGNELAREVGGQTAKKKILKRIPFIWGSTVQQNVAGSRPYRTYGWIAFPVHPEMNTWFVRHGKDGEKKGSCSAFYWNQWTTSLSFTVPGL